MRTVNINIDVPEAMTLYLDNEDKDRTFERNAMMLYPFIHSTAISHGKAAEILGVNKIDLIEFYNSYGISYLNQSKDELLEDLETLNKLKEKAV